MTALGPLSFPGSGCSYPEVHGALMEQPRDGHEPEPRSSLGLLSPGNTLESAAGQREHEWVCAKDREPAPAPVQQLRPGQS